MTVDAEEDVDEEQLCLDEAAVAADAEEDVDEEQLCMDEAAVAADEDQDVDEEQVQFCLRWNLNEDAQQKLVQLSAHARKIVMESFDPPAHMTEVNGKFIAFAASVQKMHVAGHQLDDFVSRWSLNEDAERKLRSLSPEVLEAVMAGFAPPAHMTEVSGKFIAFAASIEKAPAIGTGVAHRAVQHEPLEAFCQHWALNEDARAKLAKLTPEAQRIVMEGFSPPPTLQDVNGKFIMFATSIEKAQVAPFANKGKGKDWVGPLVPAVGRGIAASATGNGAAAGGKGKDRLIVPRTSLPQPAPAQASKPSAAELHAFYNKWSLNEDAINKMAALAPDVQRTVIDSFAPSPRLTEVSGKFIMFAVSIEKARATGGDWKTWDGAAAAKPAVAVAARPIAAKPPLVVVPAKPAMTLTRQSAPNASTRAQQLESFCTHWNLNADARNKLFELTAEMQDTVMSNFQPPPGFHEVNGKFINFAVSIQKARRNGGAGDENRYEAQVETFCTYWSLNDDARAKMWKLIPEVQQIVMSSFEPPAGMADVNGKFIMFATSIERAQHGKGKGGTGQTGEGKGIAKGGQQKRSFHAAFGHW